MRNEVAKKLKNAGLKVETDLRNEKINYKVREHSVAKVPVILVVGRREAEEGTVNVRRLGSRDQESKTSTRSRRCWSRKRRRPTSSASAACDDQMTKSVKPAVEPPVFPCNSTSARQIL
jgi:threonyl-tRNA synthetase